MAGTAHDRGRTEFDEAADVSVSGGSSHELRTEDWNSARTIFTKDIFQFIIVHVLAEVLDVHVGELFGSGAELGLALFARFEAADEPADRNVFRIQTPG